MKYSLIFLILLVYFISSGLVQSGYATEQRTAQLTAIADSFIYFPNNENNYGRETNLLSEYDASFKCVGGEQFTCGTRVPYTISVFLPRNSKITGSFIVTAGGNKDIDFWIMDPDDTLVMGLSRVTAYTISFTTQKTGRYDFVFDNSFSWFTSKKVSLSDVYAEYRSTCYHPVFLKFDLSPIPPRATITSANLKLYCWDLSAPSVVGAHYCSDDDWDQNHITPLNAPIDSIKLESTWDTTIDTPNKWYSWEILWDVVRALEKGKLTEILSVTNGGLVNFVSSEGDHKPTLEITYEYASVSISITPTLILEGQNIGVNVETNPDQSGGQLKIQHSTDKLDWTDVGTYSGGSIREVITPPATWRTLYVRAVWVDQWPGGIYQTESEVKSLVVIPLIVPIGIVMIIFTTIFVFLRIYFTRRRHH